MAAKKAAEFSGEEAAKQLKAEARTKQHHLKLGAMVQEKFDPVLFERVTLDVSMDRRIVGGTPVSKDLIEAWLRSRMPDVVAADRERIAATTLEQVPAVVSEEADKMYTTFKQDEKGLFIDARQFKAALKESANSLKSLLQDHFEGGKREGEKSRFTALKSRVAERVFIVEERIYLLDAAGAFKPKADGVETNAIHVMTPLGERTALKTYDFCNAGTKLRFEVAVLRDGIIDGVVLNKMLNYAAENGLGAMRSQGNGTFSWAVSAS